MQVYLTVIVLVLAVLYRTTLSDHDSGEMIEFGDSDTSFYNQYEHYSQSKLTGGQIGGMATSPSSGQFVGQSDDKDDVQYVYVSPSGSQINGQNTGQFNSHTLGLSNGQLRNKPDDLDDQYVTIGQPNSQTGWQLQSQTAGKTVYTPTGVFTNQNRGQFIAQTGGQLTSQSAGQIGDQNVQPFIHSSNMPIEMDDDQYIPTSHTTSQHGSKSIGQSTSLKTGHSQGQTSDILKGQSRDRNDDHYVYVAPQAGQNSQFVSQNTMPFTAQSTGQSNDNKDHTDGKYLTVGQAGGQLGISNGPFTSQNTVPFTVQSSGQFDDKNDQNDDNYLTVGLSGGQGIFNGQFTSQNTVPFTVQSSGQFNVKNDQNDDNYLTVGQSGGQGIFNGQFASQNIVPYTVQSSGQFNVKNDQNDDNYLPVGQSSGQLGIFNGPFTSQNTVPFTVQSSGQFDDKNDQNDDNHLTVGLSGGQGIFNGQFTSQNTVPFTVQSSGQFNVENDQNDDNYLTVGQSGGQGIFNGQFASQNSVPYTIQTAGQFDDKGDDQFVHTGQPFTQTSGKPITSIYNDQDDDNYLPVGQLGGQLGGQVGSQFTSQPFVQGGGNTLGQQNIVHTTVHMDGSGGLSVGQTNGQTHGRHVDQLLAQPVVQTTGQLGSEVDDQYPIKRSRLSIGQYPGQQDDRPDSPTRYPESSHQEKDVDAGGMCNNYKTKGGWAYRPIYGSCNQYLQCNSDNRASLLTCAAGTFYDGTSCRHSAEVYCPYDPCQAREPGFKYTDGQSCYGYYKCVKGKSRYHTCPDGFYFNSNKQICISDDTCQKNNLIHPCSYGTTYPFPGRPEMFYLYDGREVFYPMKCPKGLWYRSDICSCDWIVPGISSHEGCKPMYHFQYNGNFLEAYNRIQQVPNTGVAIYRKSALFSEGGQLMVWAMNNMNLDKEFAFCFEFMAKAYDGEVALLSNGYKDDDFTYKITYMPAQSLVKAYIELDDGTMAHLVVNGVHPLKPHFVRLAKYGSKIKLRIDNIGATMVKTPAHVQTSNSPLVIGAAKGCKGFVGHFDEFKFFKCVPKDFFNDYAEKKK